MFNGWLLKKVIKYCSRMNSCGYIVAFQLEVVAEHPKCPIEHYFQLVPHSVGPQIIC